MKPYANPLDWKMCDCARCGRELLGESMLGYRHSLAKLTDTPFVADRIDGRAFCMVCFDVVQKRMLKEAW